MGALRQPSRAASTTPAALPPPLSGLALTPFQRTPSRCYVNQRLLQHTGSVGTLFQVTLRLCLPTAGWLAYSLAGQFFVGFHFCPIFEIQTRRSQMAPVVPVTHENAGSIIPVGNCSREMDSRNDIHLDKRHPVVRVFLREQVRQAFH